MNKKEHFKYLIATIIILGGLFYWFQIRPTSIRSGCAEYSKNRIAEDGNKKSIDKWQDTYDLYFKACINSKGLR